MNSRITDQMTRGVVTVPPQLPVRDAAIRMRDRNVGCLPVCDGGAVIGMITDRDLALRVFAEGRDPSATIVADVMTRDLICCDPGDRMEDALVRMARWRVRRIPVISNDGRLVGIITLGKAAESDWSGSGEVLAAILQARETAPHGSP